MTAAAEPAPRLPADRPFGVRASLTPRRRPRSRRITETDDFLIFARRIVRAAGRRVGNGDVEDLATLAELSRELDAATAAAVAELHASGRSWADIARPLGITRESAWQRWSRP